ncbi:hypothetical protein K438DRAFT_1169928 [Mycena galopus ATCC 62051]|nr:hypothetical protein K438DRAFT_1169928 [Mycena galopus ATCC 62051]
MAPRVPPNFRRISFGDIDLRREISRENYSDVVDRQRTQRSIRRVYSAHIEQLRLGVTVAVYQGNGAEEEWRTDIAKYMAVRHPNIIQVYGTASLGNIHATIFHDDLIPVQHFGDSYRHSHFASVYIYAYCNSKFYEVKDYFLSTFRYQLYEDACTGFVRRSTRQFCADLIPSGICYLNVRRPISMEIFRQQELELLGTPNMEATVVDSLTLEHYHSICYWKLY